jgi:nicotinate-nucleotide adenylyltransferase
LRRIAVLGGTFDPVHNGHLAIARALVGSFALDQFVFLPAFHAPHKAEQKPTSAYHRYAMLAIATSYEAKFTVSTVELDKGMTRYSIETIPELIEEYSNSKLYFVMGADSWMDIRTWKQWESVLTISDHIIVTRPGYDLTFEHVTADVRSRIVDLRGKDLKSVRESERASKSIYVTDAVEFDTSATEVREDFSDGNLDQENDVPLEVAKYIEKYELYI